MGITKNKINHIENLANKMRKKSIEMAFKAGKNGAHLGPALSCIEIIACLYGGIMNVDSTNPNMDNRDFFIPSKAHCVLAFYTALAYTGFIDEINLESFELNNSELSGHPVMNEKIGIEFSGGSLGMGLSQGVGLALASKIQNKSNISFVLLGDGECNEGAIWEASMSAAAFKLDNLIAIIDRNKLQYDGYTEEIMPLLDLKSKFQSFGFNVYDIDGHNIEQLYGCLDTAKKYKNCKPNIIIANTIKGKGVSFMENKKEWHHSVLSQKDYNISMKELEGSIIR